MVYGWLRRNERYGSMPMRDMAREKIVGSDLHTSLIISITWKGRQRYAEIRPTPRARTRILRTLWSRCLVWPASTVCPRCERNDSHVFRPNEKRNTCEISCFAAFRSKHYFVVIRVWRWNYCKKSPSADSKSDYKLRKFLISRLQVFYFFFQKHP